MDVIFATVMAGNHVGRSGFDKEMRWPHLESRSWELREQTAECREPVNIPCIEGISVDLSTFKNRDFTLNILKNQGMDEVPAKYPPNIQDCTNDAPFVTLKPMFRSDKNSDGEIT
jgi:hypothetical protein